MTGRTVKYHPDVDQSKDSIILHHKGQDYKDKMVDILIDNAERQNHTINESSQNKDFLTQFDLRELHKQINRTCIDVAIERGKEYNLDGNMIGSYQEYSIDDITSIIKVKAIRMKHSSNSKVIKDSCIDIINYSIEVLRRFENGSK